MKTKSLWIAVLASAVVIAQAQAGTVRAAGGGRHAGAVAHAAPAVHAPARAGGFSSMHSMPRRSFGGRMIYPRQRYSSFTMHPSRPAVFRRPNMYPNRVTYTRSGPFTAATIRQPNQINRFQRSANYRNRAATSVWNQRNTRRQFRNGNNHLRSDWQKHMFAQRSGDWHRDWNRHSDHWWNGHRCCFINGTWVIFNVGFDPWWPSSVLSRRLLRVRFTVLRIRRPGFLRLPTELLRFGRRPRPNVLRSKQLSRSVSGILRFRRLSERSVLRSKQLQRSIANKRLDRCGSTGSTCA